jgi:hypothetical protein
MTTGKLGAVEVFAADMIAEEACKMGCMAGRGEIAGGIMAMMNLAEVWGWVEKGPGKPLRTVVAGVHFFAENGGCGVEVSGQWRLEYEPGGAEAAHKIVICERGRGGEWVLQDTPEGGAAKVFLQRGRGGEVYISRKIHFSRGKLWDPSQGVHADAGYDEGGGVMFTRSFRDGQPVDDREGLPGSPLKRGTRPSRKGPTPVGLVDHKATGRG